ncbi:mitochondrial phosphate carrier protein 3, mitochondrial-like protein, partial [Tanacetum coccineum]
KVRVQTRTGSAKGMSDGLPKITKAEGVAGLYRGLANSSLGTTNSMFSKIEQERLKEEENVEDAATKT